MAGRSSLSEKPSETNQEAPFNEYSMNDVTPEVTSHEIQPN